MISSENIQISDDKALHQKLVLPPLLIDDRKFSIRVYVVSTKWMYKHIPMTYMGKV